MSRAIIPDFDVPSSKSGHSLEGVDLGPPKRQDGLGGNGYRKGEKKRRIFEQRRLRPRFCDLPIAEITLESV
jgi:hypothetical protein